MLLMIALSPLVIYRMVAQGRYRQGWAGRLGWPPVRKNGGYCVWIHAVSMGEVNAARTLVAELARQDGVEIVISSTTDTGLDRARQVYGGNHTVFCFPWDISWFVARALRRVRPDVCIMMEGEVWPNFTAQAYKMNIPVVIANARVGGSKGWPRYQKIAALVRGMFSRLALVLAQDEVHAERFRFLGVRSECVKVNGSLKYDTAQVVDEVAGAGELAEALALKGERIWVAGQTGPGEEAMVLDCYAELLKCNELKDLRLVMVPRKPERFDEAARLILERGYELVRYSEIKGAEKFVDSFGQPVILGDTMGDLRKFYSLAEVVFVGRSLVPMGGSDMMEVAALAKPVVTGPYTENFAETVRLLVESEGVEVVADSVQLGVVVGELLEDTGRAARLGKNGREVIIANQGATKRTVEAVLQLLRQA